MEYETELEWRLGTHHQLPNALFSPDPAGPDIELSLPGNYLDSSAAPGPHGHMLDVNLLVNLTPDLAPSPPRTL